MGSGRSSLLSCCSARPAISDNKCDIPAVEKRHTLLDKAFGEHNVYNTQFCDDILYCNVKDVSYSDAFITLENLDWAIDYSLQERCLDSIFYEMSKNK